MLDAVIQVFLYIMQCYSEFFAFPDTIIYRTSITPGLVVSKTDTLKT